MSAPKTRGFTLIEVVIALGIAGAALGITFGAVRVGLAAWRQGEARAEGLQHARSLVAMLEQVVGGAYPYRTGAGDSGRILFEGEPDRLGFVTTAPAVPPAAPIAFVAVRLALEDSGLTLRQGVLPARDPLEGTKPALSDTTVTAVRFRYFRGKDGAWREHWSGADEQGLPAAVEITFTTARRAGPPVVIPIRTVTP
jgi:prepilin-type N-terminal cleavage/methylation domain-containing protein